MIRLLVNADDLGAGKETDRGILKAFQDGIVTSASLLPNGPSFASAVQEARLSALPVGVHLNLSEGISLTGPIPDLTDATGRLPGKYRLRQILAESPPDSEYLLREFTAQVERVFDGGLHPDHIDTHQHFFLFPAAMNVVLQVARKFDIRALRLPMPAEADPAALPYLSEEVALYRRLAPAASIALCDSGFRFPAAIFGMTSLDCLDERRLIQTLARIPSGTWELMVHPGYSDPQNPFSGPQREKELEALVSPQVRRAAEDLGIQFITFRDMSCER